MPLKIKDPMMMKSKVALAFIVLLVAGFAVFISFDWLETNSYFSQLTIVPEPKKSSISLLFFGDAMFGRNVGAKIQKGVDVFQFMPSTSTIFTAHDAVILNLEGPITASTTRCQTKAYSFRFEPDTASLLSSQGVTAVSLANNHANDCYKKGREDTRAFLRGLGVISFGGATTTESYAVMRIMNKEIILVGIDLTIDYQLHPEYLQLIKKLKKDDNLVIVSIHWGEEYRQKPTAYQLASAKKLIEQGSDAIIGHHPHIVEPMQIIEGKPVFYSLGNYIFDQIGEDRNTGIGVSLTYWPGASTTVAIHPIEIDKSRPKLMTGEKRLNFCKEFLREFQQNIMSECDLVI